MAELTKIMADLHVEGFKVQQRGEMTFFVTELKYFTIKKNPLFALMNKRLLIRKEMARSLS